MSEYLPIALQGISLVCGILLISIACLRLGSNEVTFSETAVRSLLEIIVVLSPILATRVFKEVINPVWSKEY